MKRTTSRPTDSSKGRPKQTDQQTDQKNDQKNDQRTDRQTDQKNDRQTIKRTTDRPTDLYRQTDQPTDRQTFEKFESCISPFRVYIYKECQRLFERIESATMQIHDRPDPQTYFLTQPD